MGNRTMEDIDTRVVHNNLPTDFYARLTALTKAEQAHAIEWWGEDHTYYVLCTMLYVSPGGRDREVISYLVFKKDQGWTARFGSWNILERSLPTAEAAKDVCERHLLGLLDSVEDLHKALRRKHV